MGMVIPFEERAVARLRERLGAVEEANQDLLAFARGHSGAVASIHDAMLAALEADGLEALFHVVTQEWPLILGLDSVALALVVGDQGFRADADGVQFVPLTPGPLDLVTFANPTNFYTDTHIDNYSAPPGTTAADFSKPFTGTLFSFDGLTYEQMVTLLTGLSSVQFVRFEVPEGSSARLVLDAVTAVPEPGAALLLLAPLALLRRVRRH